MEKPANTPKRFWVERMIVRGVTEIVPHGRSRFRKSGSAWYPMEKHIT
jgi:hypothetical protein